MNSYSFIYSFYSYSLRLLRKIEEKQGETAEEKKWVKEENKLAFMIESLLCEFNLFYKPMRTDKNKKINKTNLPPPPSPPTSVTAFVIAENLLGLWLQKFETFTLFLLTVLLKIKTNCMSALFFLKYLFVVGRKKTFLNFPIKYSDNKC